MKLHVALLLASFPILALDSFAADGRSLSVRSSGEFGTRNWTQTLEIAEGNKVFYIDVTSSPLERFQPYEDEAQERQWFLYTKAGDGEGPRSVFAVTIMDDGVPSVSAASYKRGQEAYTLTSLTLGTGVPTEDSLAALNRAIAAWNAQLSSSGASVKVPSVSATAVREVGGSADKTAKVKSASPDDWAKFLESIRNQQASPPPYPQYGGWQPRDLTDPGWRRRQWLAELAAQSEAAQ